MPQKAETFAMSEKKRATIAAFANIIKEYRQDAINGRKHDGLEQIWEEDAAFYEGCDDIGSRYRKSPSQTGPLLELPARNEIGTRSTVFLKITRPYCDAAAARVADMLLPTDERNWAIRPKPVAELIKLQTQQPSLQGMAPTPPPELPPNGLATPPTPEGAAPSGQAVAPVTPAPAPGGAAPTPPPNAPPNAPPAAPPTGAPGEDMQKTMGNLQGSSQAPVEAPRPPEGAPAGPPPPPPLTQAEKDMIEAKKRAELAQTQIDDWHVAGRYHAEVRKVIENCARLGTGILKGPVPTKKRSKAALKNDDGSYEVQIEEKTIPQSMSISPWNLWPDPSCGDNIQNGAWIFENAEITARKLAELKSTVPGVPSGYIDEQIDACLKEGPILCLIDNHRPTEGYEPNGSDLFEIWYFHGTVPVKEMEAAGCTIHGARKDQYPCQVIMVNDRVIKITMSHLDSGEFPYDVMVWQPKVDSWAGVGVARQMRECQKGANAAVRNLMDNAGMSSGPMIIIDQSKVVPANGKFEITPRKVWYKNMTGDDVGDVRQAFTSVAIDSRQQELLNIVQFWLKQAEDTTGLPMLMQGQQGSAPATVGGMTILNNNGNTILRRIARTFDDLITEPHIGRYYEYLLIHGPDDSKGEFVIDARGSSALVERDMQNQAMAQITNAALNPAFGLDPELVMSESLKGLRIDPKKMQLSDEKKKEMAMRQPPPDPRIEVAKLQTEADQAIIQAKLAAQAQEADKDRQMEQAFKTIDSRLAAANLSLDEKKAFDQAKLTMAGLAMKLNVQQKLSQESLEHDRDVTKAGHMVDMHKYKTDALAAPVEPSGKAPNGQGFQQ